MTSPTDGGEKSALGQPASLAVASGMLAVGDLSGNILFRRWPRGASTVAEAHGDWGPIAAAGRLVVTSGGWDPTVRAWDPVDAVPEWSSRPVDGRVSAVCGDDHRVLVAGADRVPPDPADVGPDASDRNKDRVRLQPSAVFDLSGDGEPREVARASGGISGLVCGRTWFAFVDDGAQRALVVVTRDETVTESGLEGEVTAVAVDGRNLVAATTAGVWRYDVEARAATRLGVLSEDDLQVLSLAVAGDRVVAATSEGLRRWPGNRAFGPQGSQPVALTTDGTTVFVLWGGGRVEQLDGDGTVLAHDTVPHRT